MPRLAGSRNKLSIAREEAARAEITAAVKAARSSGKADVVFALDEMYKAVAISQGVAAKLRPKDITQDAQGNVTIHGGDLNAFKQWFEQWVKCVELLAKYQLPPIKAMDAPTPPPSQEEIERGSKITMGLRVFEGGREVKLIGMGEDDEEA
jgi:hypothetical protein